MSGFELKNLTFMKTHHPNLEYLRHYQQFVVGFTNGIAKCELNEEKNIVTMDLSQVETNLRNKLVRITKNLYKLPCL
jgi:hypothetical protein